MLTKARILGVLTILAAIMTAGCSSGKSTPATSVAISPSAARTIDQGQQVALTATVTNDTLSKGVSWSVSGASCSGSTCGTLSNVTATSATYVAPSPLSANLSVTVTATSAADTTKSASVSITDTPAPSISTTSLPAATVGTAYSTTLAATGGAGTLTWSISAGTLPAGLSLNASTGAIAGTPATAATSTFTAQVSDSGNPAMTATHQFSLTVNPAPLAIMSTSLPNGTVNSNYGTTLQTTGGTTPYTWAVTTGSLPAGLSLNTSTGAITGIPTASGTSTFKVTVTDSTTPTAMTAVQQFSILVNATLSVTTTTLPNATVGTNYNQTLQSSGGTAPVTWSVTVGSLPAGLTLNGATGVISGSPTASGTSNFTVQASDSSSPTQTATQALSILVNVTPLQITTTSLPSGTVGVSYSTSLQSSGGTPPVTWSVTVGSLPAGLSLNASTGAITGSPTTAGTSNFTVTATDSTTPTAQTATQALSITINNSGVNDAELNGHYAFLLSGYDASGPVEIVGSFTADGAGNLTTGLEDVNRVTGVATSQSFTGNYAIGADNRGTLAMGSSTFQFSIGSISSGVGAKGHIVEFDATGTNVVGVFEKQDTTAFSLSAAAGDYAFGFTGLSSSVNGARLAIAGRFTVSSTGAITNGELDADDAGTTNNFTSVTGTATVAASGRGTTTLLVNGGTINTVFYVVSANESLYIGIDPLSGGNGVYSGSALKQSGSFSNSSLSGISVISVQAETTTSGTTDVQVGLLTTDGAGSYTLATDENNAGVVGTNSGSGTYSVASNGRVTTTGGKHPPVIYLVTANQGFLVGTDLSITAGSFQPQAAGPFSNSSFSGNYFFGDLPPVVSSSGLTTGVATSDGNGNISGTNDQNQSGTLTAGQAFTATYSAASNGRITVTSGSDTNVIYLVSGSKAIIMSTKSGNQDSTISEIDK
jgi:hypothetical protein